MYLEGSVQRGSDRLRVNVQLIDAETGVHLWAERFDKPVADLLDCRMRSSHLIFHPKRPIDVSGRRPCRSFRSGCIPARHSRGRSAWWVQFRCESFFSIASSNRCGSMLPAGRVPVPLVAIGASTAPDLGQPLNRAARLAGKPAPFGEVPG